MKKIKKFLLTIAMTMIFSVSAFAASGFEFLFQLAGGAGVVIPNKEAKDLGIKGTLSADADVSAQIGYMFQVKDGFGISVLGELGYSFDGYSMGYGSGAISSGSVGGGNTTYSAEASLSIEQLFHSFKLGLLPKFNIGFGGRHGLAIGIGGGVKIPLAGNMSMTSTIAVNDVASDAGIKTEDKITLSRQDITDLFSPSVIGYMKVTFDYYLFFTDNIAMNFGLYLGGDFAPKQKETKIGGDAFDIGLQLGFRFGPKA
ncbi:PorT family protein [Brachyspira aalborgi]|uniref:PorT family protein n=1 Tax=Brachyspira aalborgi TaxID=29522 RepID=A0A5C8D6X0_9SPIR|nr:PorT family protein [Brachyspira aalborgi]TXJ21199.1 PorT family protein [Brachyspira aalborgi]